MSSYPHQPGPQVGQHIGDYELVSHLARGDMGEVFLAHHPKSGRQLAIKVLDGALCADPQLLQFYEHEVWTVNHLDHPAIVDVVDFGKLDSGRAYLVMKFLRGRSLAEHLAEHGRFGVEQVRDLLLPALEALVAVHGAGVTHKDIKPSNIFLVQQPDGGFAPQLLDTGLAHLRPLAAVPGSAAQLASKELPLYKPPEQIAGDLQAVGPWSDIYSAAAMAFHLLGGRPPFIGATAAELADQHLNAPPPDLTGLRPDVHPALAKALVQGMAKRPADRFQTMAAFLSALRSAASRPAPTLRGATAVPEHGAGPPVVVPVLPVAPVAPMRADHTPPPTMRIDAGQFPLPSGGAPVAPQYGPAPVAPQYAAAPMAPQHAPAPVAPQYSPSAPPGLVAPLPPEARAPSPSRSSTMTVVFVVLGIFLVVGVVVGMIVALGDREKKEEEQTTAKVDSMKPDVVMARRVPPTMAPPSMVPPAVAMAVTPPPVLPKADRYRIDIRNRPWKGAEHARVTVVVYCGFAGYYCRSSRGDYRRILSDYPQDVKLVWMDFPLHYYKRAMPAAVAAAEVHAQRGRAGFWKMHDRIYANPYKHTDDNLVKWAAEAGADSAKVRVALSSLKHKAAIEALMGQARTIGVSYTPAVFVNGVRVPSAKRYADLEARVRSEIALAKKTLAAGTVKLPGYYAHVQKGALTRKSLPLATRPHRPYKPYKPIKPYKPYRPFGFGGDTVYFVPVTRKNPQKGSADALVTIVIFGDFECPFTFRLTCALRVALKKNSQDIRLVWMNNPRSYHRRALIYAEAAMEAFAQKSHRGFWALHDRLFPLDLCKADGSYRFGFFRRRRELTDAVLASRARKAGLHMGRFRRALGQHTHKKRILSERRLTEGHYSSSTPTMYINGKRVYGAKTVAELATLLRTARTEAKRALRTKRVSRAKLYDTIMKSAQKPRNWP